MKNIAPAFAAHLKQQVTTICTCIVIRRNDGRSFHFTDHDRSVFYANQQYVPYDSFARFSITSSVELEVDNLEIRGMINSSFMARDDIAAGLFDWSAINVFAINWMEPNQGRVMLRTGHLGEFTMDEDGTFRAEIRGLSQVFSTKIGEVYQAECRADLGDGRCKVPLSVPDWEPSTRYCAGTVIRAAINPAAGYINLPVANPSFEADGSVADSAEITGWTTFGDTTAGAWGTFTSTAFGSVPSSKYGTYFVGHINHTDPLTNVTANSTDLGLYQDVDPVLAGASTTDLDSGLCRLELTVAYAKANASDTSPQARLFAIDDQNTQIGVIYDSGALGGAEDTWLVARGSNLLVPPLTRKFRIDLLSHKKAGNFAGSAFDHVVLALNTPSGTLGSSDQYGGVAFKAQNTGTSGASLPSFSNLLDSTTTDNDITWVTIPAFAETATVASVSTTPGMFTPTALTGGDEYYDGGLLVWETGLNAGRTQEVFSYADGVIRLFIRPFHVPQVGDRFTIHPGCDKTRATCGSKFNNIINFRGEPDVPGMDEYMRTPNSGGGTQFFIGAGGTPT